ncbi:MAG: CP12 domain-containing protein [Elainellaceae cyanobacterium]
MTNHTANRIADNEDQLHAAIAQARQACQSSSDSPECATAWDIVEELQAELAHRREAKPRSSLDIYCEQNPDALECRIYDN